MKLKITLRHFSEEGEPEAADSPAAEESETLQPPQPEQTDKNEDTGEDAQPVQPDGGEVLETARQIISQTHKNTIKETWREDAKVLAEMYPSFNMRNELQNNVQFGALLRAGVSLKSAYEVTHLEDIIGTAMQYAARKASEKTANSIAAGSSRPVENGIMNSAPSVTRTDVRSLSEKDILKILDRVSRGETVSF